MELVSSQYEQITGLPKKDFSAKQWLEPVHPEDILHVQNCEKAAEKFLFTYLPQIEITSYKVCYSYRMRTLDGSYKNTFHQAIALNLSQNGSIGHVLGVETIIDHISPQPSGTISFVHLKGEKNYLNISTNNPRFVEGDSKQHGLSKQEVNIIRLISYGLSNEQLAEELYISVHTVQTHRANILKKESATNMTSVVSKYIRKGIV